MNLDKNEKRKYTLSSYDPNWVLKFEKIKKFLESVFKKKAIRIEHIGSTSIYGMKAKPLIDILMLVQKIEDFTEEKGKMTPAGYGWEKDYIAPNTLYFYKISEGGSKTENIHICEIGSTKEKQFLIMRDYLREFPERAQEYSDLKEKNFTLYPDDYPTYREAKNLFLQKMEKESYEWHNKKI